MGDIDKVVEGHKHDTLQHTSVLIPRIPQYNPVWYITCDIGHWNIDFSHDYPYADIKNFILQIAQIFKKSWKEDIWKEDFSLLK